MTTTIKTVAFTAGRYTTTLRQTSADSYQMWAHEPSTLRPGFFGGRDFGHGEYMHLVSVEHLPAIHSLEDIALSTARALIESQYGVPVASCDRPDCLTAVVVEVSQ